MNKLGRVLAVVSLFASVASAQDQTLLRAKFDLTAAQVAGLGSTPVEILPAVPGFYYRVAHGTFTKRAGSAFTITSAGHYVQIQYENASHIPANNFLVNGVLNTTDEASATGNPASISQLTSGAGIGGVGLRLGVNAGGSYSGDGSDCILDLYYWLLPATAEELDEVESTPLP